MKQTRRKRKSYYGKILLAGLITGVIAFIVYGMVDKGFRDLFDNIGISNYYLQGSIIIAVLLALLFFVGYKIKDALKKSFAN